MTRATLLAALAGGTAAVALLELAAVRTAARRARHPGAARSRRRARRIVAAALRVGRRLGAPAPPRDLAARIDAAGAPLGLGAADVMALKGTGAATALLAGIPIAAGLPGRLPLLGALAAPLAGFLAPDLWLARCARRRAAIMEAELPDALDLLRVCVEAGLAPGRALAEVGRRDRGLLAAEWHAAARRLALGIPSETVLATLRRRCPAAGTAALLAALERGERHGTPLGPALAAQTREARAARARRTAEHAAKAAPKIQLVVALLLVPSVMLFVAAALVAGLTS